eukprot:1182858-Prorocentrum_minimum.AAC.3
MHTAPAGLTVPNLVQIPTESGARGGVHHGTRIPRLIRVGETIREYEAAHPVDNVNPIHRTIYPCIHGVSSQTSVAHPRFLPPCHDGATPSFKPDRLTTPPAMAYIPFSGVRIT